jgi:ParB family transcriptional regulator, chromosome partitioning protein
MSLDKIFEIDLKDIEVGKFNVRHSNVMKDLDELAASIKKHGLLQPIVLHGIKDKPPYKLIAGQRRFLAHEKLNKKTIRAVFAGKLNAEQATLRSLVENLQRVELNHADTADAITMLYKKFDKDERKVQRETGLSLRKVRDYINIKEQASEKMKEKLAQKAVTLVDIKRALRAAQGNIKKAEELLDLMQKYQLTKYQKKRIIEYGEHDKKASARKIIEDAIRPRVEQNIMVSLPEDVRKGLEKATKEFSKEAEDIVSDVLQKWLSDQGFINE